MRALLYDDTFPRLVRDWRENPGKWLSRLVFLLGPWVCLWMVEILNENDVFNDLAPWQVLMNMVFYYFFFRGSAADSGAKPALRRGGNGAGLSLWTGEPLCTSLSGPHPLPGGRHRLAHRRQRGQRL